jgi:hypothetical protein
MITAAAATAIRITRLSSKNINGNSASLTNKYIRSQRILQYTNNYNTISSTMNLRYASFSALVATSSAWLSPASISMKRPICQSTRQHDRQHLPLIRPFTNSMTTKTATALDATQRAAPSSSSPDATLGQPIAMGSIVNVFRGGLVAVLIDDDLSKVAISLEVNIPEVVDPSGSVPDEMKKSKKSSSDHLGASYVRCIIHGRKHGRKLELY